MPTYPKRLIEVDLPIKKISEHARREKSIRHGHISTLHIWWARRPLAACRAVICAALWPDPGDPNCPKRFKKEAARLMKEFRDKRGGKPYKWDDGVELRKSLLEFIADFANWDNSTNKDFLETSRALTQVAHESLGGETGTKPLVVDPFAGGGAMPVTTISYEYYKNDLRRTMTDVIGVTDYTPPTKLNPLETIASPNMGTFTISYDNLNRRQNITMGNGITATYTYDDASQLTNLVFKDGAVTKTSHQYPLFDDVGNIKTEMDLSGTHNYNYDALYRLTSTTHPTGNPNEFFNYIDPVGSVGNRTSSHLSSFYTTNELNRLTEDDSYFYGYDADGNLISKQNKSTNETTYFYFDAENKLVQVDKYNSTPTLISSVSYSYDGFGRRVKKNVNGTVTYYVYDMEDIRFETDVNGNITAEYTHGSGIDEPLAMRKNGVNYYYHVNGLGSVTALTDSNKTVVQSYVYDSFGQIISQTGSIQNPYTFTGREYDPETGLYYYRSRYYDAKIGRFISEDPIGLAGGDVNLYVMVGNNPVNWIDPWGLKQCKGKARVLKGNPRHIGKQGGFYPKKVSGTGAAIDPKQWDGDKGALRPYLDDISGEVDGQKIFDNISEVIGPASARDKLKELNPNILLIELPGGEDLGLVDITVEVPDCLSCPEGTK